MLRSEEVFKNTFFIDVNGVRLHVYDSLKEGCKYTNDTVLIFLHGVPGQISNWKYQVNYFKKCYRVIAYDQRGYGKSDKPVKVSINDYLEDLKQIIGILNLTEDQVILIGHSFGGIIAQTYASENEVKGLVLIGSLIRLKASLLDKIIWKTPPILWRKLLFTNNPLTRRFYKSLFLVKQSLKTYSRSL